MGLSAPFSTKHSSHLPTRLTPPELSFSAMKEVLNIEPLTPIALKHQLSFLFTPLSENELPSAYADELFIEEEVTAEDESAAQASGEWIEIPLPDALRPLPTMNRQHSLCRGSGDEIVLAGLVFSAQIQHKAVKLAALSPSYDLKPREVFKEAFADAMDTALRSIFDPSMYPELFMRPSVAGRPFLPALDHLTSIESRSAFGTYEMNLDVQERATTAQSDEAVPQECCTGACTCLVYQRGKADDDAPVVEALDVLDGIVSDELGFEGEIVEAASFYTSADHTPVNATEPSPSFPSPTETLRPYQDKSQPPSNTSDPTSPPPSPPLQFIVDTTTQSHIFFTALNILTDDLDDSETLPRIHRSGPEFDVDDMDIEVDEFVEVLPRPSLFTLLADEVRADMLRRRDDPVRRTSGYRDRNPLEIFEEVDSDEDFAPPSPSDSEASIGFGEPASWLRPAASRRADFMDDSDNEEEVLHGSSPMTFVQLLPTRPTSFVDDGALDLPEDEDWSTCSSSSDASSESDRGPVLMQQRPTRRVHFAVDEDIDVPENEDGSSRSSHDASIGFHSGARVVQSLPTRHVHFLDEDTEDYTAAPYSPASSSSSSADSLYSLCYAEPPVLERFHALFDASIWQYEPSLQLTYPLGMESRSADLLPDADILNTLEADINGLIAYMLECIAYGRFDELTELGSDLHWATSTISRVFPTLDLLESLGGDIELLLKRVVAVGTSESLWKASSFRSD